MHKRTYFIELKKYSQQNKRYNTRNIEAKISSVNESCVVTTLHSLIYIILDIYFVQQCHWREMIFFSLTSVILFNLNFHPLIIHWNAVNSIYVYIINISVICTIGITYWRRKMNCTWTCNNSSANFIFFKGNSVSLEVQTNYSKKTIFQSKTNLNWFL